MRLVVASCLLFVSGCFLTGYDALEEMDATVVPTSDAARDRNDDAAGDKSRDAGHSVAPPSEGGATDAKVPPDTGKVDPDDAGTSALGRDAQADGAVGPDASVAMDASAPTDGGSGDGGCGPSGCVVDTTCVAKSCPESCNEVPDPGNEPTLDCQYDCSSVANCSASCTADNTCQTNCSGGSTCRTSCPYAATCWTKCLSASNCGGNCQLGSSCSFDCSDSICTQVTCALGAVCRMKCDSSSTCSFAFCGNLVQQSCPDGTTLCAPLGTGC